MTALTIYFNFVSLTIFIAAVFTIVLGIFLLLIPSKSKATFHLSLAFLYFCGLNLSYFFGFSVYHPWAAYHDWFVLLFALLGVSHIAQFLIYFSGVENSRLPNRILAVYYLLSLITTFTWCYDTLSRDIVFQKSGQFWNFSIGTLEENLSLAALLIILSILIVGLWRIKVADKAIKKRLGYFLAGFMFLSFAPAVANTLYMNKLISKDTFQLIYCLITIHGWFVIFILYLNTTKEKVSFLAKILTVSFTTYMILLIIFSYALLKVSDEAYYYSKVSNAELAVYSFEPKPKDLAYIISTTDNNNMPVYHYKREAVDPVFSVLQTPAQSLIADSIINPGGYFIRQNRQKTTSYYALTFFDSKNQVTYETGFDYVDYRKYLHESSLYILYLLILVLIVLIVGLPLFMQGSLTKPINNIIRGLKETTKGNYEQIPANDAEDEIGYMARSFNEMVDTIAQSKKQIMAYTQNLEEMVQERTEKLRKAQQDLITAARRAGMADIASNVLHNVGNVLNSVNINTDNLRSAVDNINADGMKKANELYLENRNDPVFFNHPEGKGQKMVEFYALLCESMIDTKEEINHTLDRLEDQIKVIKEVIYAQQQYASGPSFQERINLVSAVEQMLLIQKDSISKHNITIVNNINEVPDINGHSIKLLHILINLYVNARDAVLGNDPENRIITIKTENKNSKVLLTFSDNGIGFEEHLNTKIFQLGYSTKKAGRGFGLHSCANDIREMNGSISAKSKGIKKGATFTLTSNLAKK